VSNGTFSFDCGKLVFSTVVIYFYEMDQMRHTSEYLKLFWHLCQVLFISRAHGDQVVFWVFECGISQTWCFKWLLFSIFLSVIFNLSVVSLLNSRGGWKIPQPLEFGKDTGFQPRGQSPGIQLQLLVPCVNRILFYKFQKRWSSFWHWDSNPGPLACVTIALYIPIVVVPSTPFSIIFELTEWAEELTNGTSSFTFQIFKETTKYSYIRLPSIASWGRNKGRTWVFQDPWCTVFFDGERGG